MSKPFKVAFVSDIHAPYHDRKAWALFIKVLKDNPTKGLFFGGDIVDCYSVSDFDRDPQRVVRFQEEFDSAILLMEEARGLVEEAWFKPGNHEARWEREKNRHSALVSLRSLKIEKMLELERLKIKFVPHENDQFKIGDLYYLHGDEGAGGSIFPARNLYLREQGNIIFGHYHKSQVFYNRLKNGTMHGSFANPCLCSLKQDYIKGTAQWQQGFSIVEYYGDMFRVDQVVFFSDLKKLYASYGGKLYSV